VRLRPRVPQVDKITFAAQFDGATSRELVRLAANPISKHRHSMEKNNDEIPAEAGRALQCFALELEAELAELDGKFAERFAEAAWPDNVALLKAYSQERFDLIAEASLFCSASTDPGQINPLYDQLLVAGIEKTVQFLQGSLVHTSGEYREEVVSVMRLKLNGRRTRWLGLAKRKHLERHPVPIVDLPGAAEKAKPFAITPQIVNAGMQYSPTTAKKSAR
jgi:hypothetical protein